jgi:hypothetical protein
MVPGIGSHAQWRRADRQVGRELNRQAAAVTGRRSDYFSTGDYRNRGRQEISKFGEILAYPAYGSEPAGTLHCASVSYLDTRVVNYDHAPGGIDVLSRVERIATGTTDVVQYNDRATGPVSIQCYGEPTIDVWHTLATGSGAIPFGGRGRFGRLIDLRPFQ